MREAYRRIRKDAAAGVDGVTAAQYEAELEANLSGVLERFKSGRYRAPAVRRVHLEKPGTSKIRPIGIPTLEDKILQRAVLMVASAVPKMRVNGRGEDVIFFDGVFFKSSLKSIFFVS